MHADKLYEYTVIRLVPNVEREEFFNVGLVMFSKKEKYIRMEFHICPKKFELFCKDLDFNEIKENLENFKKIATGNSPHPIAILDIPARFRWLTAVRSAVVQTSRPHPGKTQDLDGDFGRLFGELVGRI